MKVFTLQHWSLDFWRGDGRAEFNKILVILVNTGHSKLVL